MIENSQEDPVDLDADIIFTVEAADTGKRLDAVLAAHTQELSRNRVQTLIKAGEATVGGAKVVEPKHRVNEGDILTLALPEAEDPDPKGEPIPLAVVFEDDHVIVVDKPAGLVVHPGAGNWTGTLVNALIHHCGESLSGIGGIKRPGIVHRIDKDTSGLLVVAKTDRAHQGLAAQFADHGRTGPLERAYSALVWGAPSHLKGTVDANLARSQVNRQKIAVVKTAGRTAITHWQVKERFGSGDQQALASLMECRLETGRTHQIRVHMAHIGHPLIGDNDYGPGFKTKANRLEEPLKGLVQGFNRQALHAGLLAFEHPVSGKTLRFESTYPEDFERLLSGLQNF
ncbi:RluA family pseudouridine synthase [Roseibium denhamense]|uniref:Pseudouridine synthase n=1 Tax=Roseibium denhamense TaxID=76305 RepID=A0ABY1NK39_9HYPH|nr:RluA family pseudouridine synthase [Roseibium denhamense]MTI06754.1 RluA family pseudouridine synthase [Roseibium denhamense]SMP11027.1 23S rRNA pseudouridine1911/1915/1917 synthase [Roseibium denhamense]